MAFHTPEKNVKLENTDEQVENPILTRLNSGTDKGRLSIIVPTENESDVQFLTFRHTTKAQERTRKRQQPIKLEPLVSSKTSILSHFWQHRRLKICYIAKGDGRFQTQRKNESLKVKICL